MTVSVGMSKRQVKRLLGPPGALMTSKDYLKQYRTVTVLGGRQPKQEFWMYHNLPPGRSTMITFQRGRVVEVMSQPTG